MESRLTLNGILQDQLEDERKRRKDLEARIRMMEAEQQRRLEEAQWWRQQQMVQFYSYM